MPQLPSTTTSTELVGENPRRHSIILQNTDANEAYILFGDGTASSSNCEFSLASGDSAQPLGWTGRIAVVWAGDGAGVLRYKEVNR